MTSQANRQCGLCIMKMLNTENLSHLLFLTYSALRPCKGGKHKCFKIRSRHWARVYPTLDPVETWEGSLRSSRSSQSQKMMSVTYLPDPRKVAPDWKNCRAAKIFPACLKHLSSVIQLTAFRCISRPDGSGRFSFNADIFSRNGEHLT